MNELTKSQRYRLSLEARRIMGKVLALTSCQSNNISIEKMRTVCNDIYNRVDEFVITLDSIQSNS